jgi:hypothetical protein
MTRADELLRRIILRASIVLLLLAACLALIDRHRFPVAIIAGGALGLAHLRSVGVTAALVAGGKAAQGTSLLFLAIRLLVVSGMLFLLIKIAGLDVLGITAGLVAVHVVTLTEGWRSSL